MMLITQKTGISNLLETMVLLLTLNPRVIDSILQEFEGYQYIARLIIMHNSCLVEFIFAALHLFFLHHDALYSK